MPGKHRIAERADNRQRRQRVEITAKERDQKRRKGTTERQRCGESLDSLGENELMPKKWERREGRRSESGLKESDDFHILTGNSGMKTDLELCSLWTVCVSVCVCLTVQEAEIS